MRKHRGPPSMEIKNKDNNELPHLEVFQILN